MVEHVGSTGMKFDVVLHKHLYNLGNLSFSKVASFCLRHAYTPSTLKPLKALEYCTMSSL